MNKTGYFGHIWNEAIFENRNKLYGAYELRESYDVRVRRAFLFCLSFIVIAIAVPLGITYYLEETVKLKMEKAIIFEPIHINDKALETRPQQQQKKQFNKNTNNGKNSAYINRPDTSQIPLDTTPAITSINIGTGADSADAINPEPAGPSGGGIVAIPSEVHNPWQVDVMPEFPGGTKAFYEFIRKNAQYPGMAREADIEVTVYISFVVNDKGVVVDAKVLRSVGYGLDEAALQAISKMPVWKPGMSHGTAVSTLMQLPVKFVTLK